MKDEDGPFAFHSSLITFHPSSFILSRSGFGPNASTFSVISFVAATNCPAMADDRLNIRTRSGSSPICLRMA